MVQDNILLSSLWCIDDFRINNKYIFITQLFNNGLVCIYDCLDEYNNVLNLPEMNNRFRVQIQFTTYYSITRPLRALLGQGNLEKVQITTIPKYFSIIMLDRKGCNRIYNDFLSCAIDKPKHESKREKTIFNIAVNWWQRHNKIPFQVTHDTKLQWLQYRITHRILGTNSYLFKIRYINSDVYSFCFREKETKKKTFILGLHLY